ncbi:MAG: glycyl-radical enzyme activating protein [Bacteroidales bacterium]|nr:glycyl-radical enzyme activating protein [Bacteroidales bacterium]MCF8352489.1 glycyl-radical enzyme activating protein [Bacteroidales bacterium]MCF8377902.1 glycyl-radical enzyme activating protein [Bacteroidales bacterium]MCF8402284.1 glycyl-radical enzyme activating protein [Bacteroidales bacterium]
MSNRIINSVIAQISNIQRFSIHDGPGIRTTVFLQGCPLSCWWCHNPECIAFETSQGREFEPNELIKEIMKDKVFFEESGGGVTFSGGEPLAQAEFLLDILKKCKEKQIHTVVDTSGYAGKNIMDSVASLSDLILFDLKLVDDEKHMQYTGVSNKMILDNLIYLDKNNARLILRFPLIPGITDTDDNLHDVIDLILSLQNKPPLEILPYHRIAEGKYDRLKLDFKLKGVKQTEKEVKAAKQKFMDNGIHVLI